MAVKRRATKRVTRRKAAKVPRAAKCAAKRVTRKAAKKAAKVPKAPKKRTAKRRTARKAAKVPRASKGKKASKKVTKRAAKKQKIKVGSMRRVWSGTCDRTKGGLTKKDLMKNKRGKIVSKKQNASSKKKFRSSALSKWVAATQKARAELGLTGFVACKKGTSYYKLAKKYFN